MPSLSPTGIAIWFIVLTLWAYILARVVARAIIRTINEKEEEEKSE